MDLLVQDAEISLEVGDALKGPRDLRFLGLVLVKSVDAEETSIIHFLLGGNLPRSACLLLLFGDILWNTLLAEGLVHGHNNRFGEMFQTHITGELVLLNWQL